MQNPVRQIIAIYCVCDDFLLARGYQDAPQAKLTTAQVITIALVASALFCGNQNKSRVFLKEHGYIQPMLSKGCSDCWPTFTSKATKAVKTGPRRRTTRFGDTSRGKVVAPH